MGTAKLGLVSALGCACQPQFTAVAGLRRAFLSVLRPVAENGKNKLVYVATGTSNQHKRPADPQPEHDSILPHKETLGQHF